jgi:hypothetical protein
MSLSLLRSIKLSNNGYAHTESFSTSFPPIFKCTFDVYSSNAQHSPRAHLHEKQIVNFHYSQFKKENGMFNRGEGKVPSQLPTMHHTPARNNSSPALVTNHHKVVREKIPSACKPIYAHYTSTFFHIEGLSLLVSI